MLVVAGTAHDLIKEHQKKRQTAKDNLAYQPINTDEESEQLVKKSVEKKKSKERLVFQVLLCFSAYTNAKKIYTIGNTDGQLECLNGIRFLSIAWVILGHTYRYMIPVAG